MPQTRNKSRPPCVRVSAATAGVPTSDQRRLRGFPRTLSGQRRAASRANGTKFGRPRKVDDSITTAKRMKADGHTGKDIVKYLGGQSGDVVQIPQ